MAEDAGLDRVVRTNLTGVSRGLHQLRQILPVGASQGGCVVTPDGKTVWANSRQNKEVRPWDIATGQPGPALPLDQETNLVLARSKDGKLLLTGTGPQARLWDAATRRPRDPPLSNSRRGPRGVVSARRAYAGDGAQSR